MDPGPRSRERRLLACIGPVPAARHDLLQGVGRPFQHVVPAIRPPLLDLPDFLSDRDHRVTESVQLTLRFALRRLDHQRPRHREGHRGRVEAIVHESLRDVFHIDARRRLVRPGVDDTLVRDQTLGAFVQDGIKSLEPARDIVGVEDRDLRRAREPFGAHQIDVHVRDWQDARAPPGRRRHRPDALNAADIGQRVSREIRRQMRRDGDRPHPGTAATMRDAERLVQVEMAHVGADVARSAEADHGVHVGAVQVDLAARRMHDVADVANSFLEHAVRRWIRDHQRGQLRSVQLGLRAQVVEVHIAAHVGLHHHDLETGHDRARRVGAVRRLRNEADRPLPSLAARLVMPANDEETRVFALRARVGLQRDGRQSGDFGQRVFQSLKQNGVAVGLLAGREWVDAREVAPRDGEHLRGGVELHGARAEWDHRRRERQVTRFEPADVAQHLRLGLVAIEHRVREIRAPTGHAVGHAAGDFIRQLVWRERRRQSAVEHGEEIRHVAERRRFLDRDRHRRRPLVIGQHAHVDELRPRLAQ